MSDCRPNLSFWDGLTITEHQTTNTWNENFADYSSYTATCGDKDFDDDFTYAYTDKLHINSHGELANTGHWNDRITFATDFTMTITTGLYDQGGPHQFSFYSPPFSGTTPTYTDTFEYYVDIDCSDHKIVDQDVATWTFTATVRGWDYIVDQPQYYRTIARTLETISGDSAADKCEHTHANFSVDFEGMTQEFCRVHVDQYAIECLPSAIRFYDQSPHQLTITIEDFGYDRLYTSSWDLTGGTYTVPIEVQLDCNQIGWETVNNVHDVGSYFEFNTGMVNYVYESYALRLDTDGIPWSEHQECGYAELTWDDVPDWCIGDVKEITQNNGYDMYEGFNCLPYAVEHTGEFRIHITKYLPVTGEVNTKWINLNILKDCSEESYFVPENPADTGTIFGFLQYTAEYRYVPTVEITSDPNGTPWNTYVDTVDGGLLCGRTSVTFENYPSSFMAVDGNELVISPTRISEIGSYFVNVIQTDNVYISTAIPQQTTEIEFIIEETCTLFDFYPQSDAFTVIIEVVYQEEIMLKLEVDGDNLSWSDHCGYSMVYSTTNLPSFCTEQSTYIECSTDLTSDIGDYTIVLTREQDGVVKTQDITISVQVDCTTKAWQEIEDPTVFYTADESAVYAPSQLMALDNQGISWSAYCGNINMDYQRSQQGIDGWTGRNSDQTMQVGPVSDLQVGEHIFELFKQDQNGEVPELIQYYTLTVDYDCTKYSFAPMTTDFTIYINNDSYIGISTEYMLGDSGLSWSRYCGFASFSVDTLPQFCELQDPAVDGVDEFDYIYCRATANFHVDNGPYYVQVTRYKDSWDYNPRGHGTYTESPVTITITVEVDCQYIEWAEPEIPFQFFTANYSTEYSPDRDPAKDNVGKEWSTYCGFANIVYTDELREWEVQISDYKLIISPPLLVSFVTTQKMKYTKISDSDSARHALYGSIADAEFEVDYIVDVICDEIPYQNVESSHDLYTGDMYSYTIPKEHELDDEDASWTSICGYASIWVQNLPEFCTLIDETFTRILCYPRFEEEIGSYEITIIQNKGDLVTNTVATLNVFKGTFASPFFTYENIKPKWEFEDSLFLLNRFESDSLNWQISPLDYLTDEDVDDELSVTVSFGTTDVLFEFDGTFLFVKIGKQAEFVKLVEQFFPDLICSFTLIAYDGKEETKHRLYFDFSKPEEPFKGVYIPEEEQEDDDIWLGDPSLIPVAKVSDISVQGKIFIQFSHPMAFPDDFEKLVNDERNIPWRQLRELNSENESAQNRNNNQIMQLNVIPSFTQDFSNIGLDWYVEVIDDQNLEVQMIFDSFSAISATGEIDSINVVFMNKSFFKTSEHSVQMQQQSLAKPLPTQVPYNSSSFAAISGAAGSLNGAAVGSGLASAGFGVVMGASLALLYGLIHMVQMYVHFPLFAIMFPGNIFGILKVFLSVAMLDLITSEDTYSITLDYNPEDGMDEYRDRFSIVGYDTTSMVYNGGDLSLLQFAIIVKFIYLISYHFLYTRECCACQVKKQVHYAEKFKEEKESLQYGWPLRFVLEAYLELCISSLIKFDARNYSSASVADQFDSFLGFLYLVVILIAPIWSLVFFTWNKDKLKEEDDLPDLEQRNFRKKFGTVYEITRVNSLINIHFTTIFLFRRLIFVFACIYLEKYYVMQVLYAIVVQIMYLNYIIQNRPFLNAEENKLELFTEGCITMFIYTFFCFTNFIPEPETRFMVGWVAMAIFLVNVLGNLVVVVRGTVQEPKRQIFRNKNAIKAWCTKKCFFMDCRNEEAKLWWIKKGFYCCTVKVKKQKQVIYEETDSEVEVEILDFEEIVERNLLYDVPYPELSLLNSLMPDLPKIETPKAIVRVEFSTLEFDKIKLEAEPNRVPVYQDSGLSGYSLGLVQQQEEFKIEQYFPEQTIREDNQDQPQELYFDQDWLIEHGKKLQQNQQMLQVQKQFSKHRLVDQVRVKKQSSKRSLTTQDPLSNKKVDDTFWKEQQKFFELANQKQQGLKVKKAKKKNKKKKGSKSSFSYQNSSALETPQHFEYDGSYFKDLESQMSRIRTKRR